MTQYLADSNIFLALASSGHPHNPIVTGWFDGFTKTDRMAFCRLTQLSFMRLLTTQEVMRQHTLTNQQALSQVHLFLSDPRMEYVVEPNGLEERWLTLASAHQKAPKLWMDAYLAGFSELTGRRLVTFDKGFRQFKALDVLVLTVSQSPA